MKLPLIADEHGDILVFSSEGDASRYLEPVDIQNHEYVFHDSEGVLVEASIDPSQKICFREKSPHVCQKEELKDKLLVFLKRLGRKPRTQDLGMIVAEVSQVTFIKRVG